MPRVGQQLRELLRVDEVALDRVLQVGLPVQLDGAGDVAAVVGAGVLVDLDEDGVRRVEIALGPVGGDQDVGACHGGNPFGCLLFERYAGDGAVERRPCDERVDLAAQADAEGRVEEGRDEREAGGDQAEQLDAGGEADDADDGEHEADQLGELQRRHRLLLGDRVRAGERRALRRSGRTDAYGARATRRSRTRRPARPGSRRPRPS